MNNEIIEEINRLSKELYESIPSLRECLERELEETERELTKIKIRRKFAYLIPDFILRLFYSEFTTNSERKKE